MRGCFIFITQHKFKYNFKMAEMAVDVFLFNNGFVIYGIITIIF
jgi:sRNA-binding regulator protein Hfq